jgi:hypothetical protein
MRSLCGCLASVATDLWHFPHPASSIVAGPRLTVSSKRDVDLHFALSDDDGNPENFVMHFQGVEAYRCTYLTSINVQMIRLAYAKVVRLEGSTWLNEILPVYDATKYRRPALQHLMTCFDDGPCFEFICAAFEIESCLST